MQKVPIEAILKLDSAFGDNNLIRIGWPGGGSGWRGEGDYAIQVYQVRFRNQVHL